MDGSWTSKLQTRSFLTFLIARNCAKPLALWRTGLLLGSLCLCASAEEDCVLGIVGRPVALPCFYPELLKSENVSIEWRRDGEVVLRSVWQGDKHEQMWGFSVATLAHDAASTGNFSLELPKVDPQEDRTNYSLFIISEESQSAPLCTVCLRIAASFSFPQLKRTDGEAGDKTAFLCQSSGGYPKPTVSWLINNTEEPPEGAVRTLAVTLDSLLYNITSYLMVNISKDASVSCIIKNPFMNETLMSTSYGVNYGPTVSRASEAMWMFSTGLCVVVGAMVIAGVAYQIHLDRISKRKKKEFQATQRGYKRRRRQHYKEETEVMKPASKETNV
ncbi:ICOS ligand-like [Salarias fasciatus]|uniref:ICOS ligand-like n=1 Tax=Salarias fasciatus TaxID=181472 RepID=UPI0011767611|nr:ICOS ligand-like [Salarias fasciatus]